MAITRFKTDKNREYVMENTALQTRAHVVVDQCSQLRLYDDRCPHRGGPLHLGKRHNSGAVTCPWHGMAVAHRRCAVGLAAIHLVSKQQLTLVERALSTEHEPLSSIRQINQKRR